MTDRLLPLLVVSLGFSILGLAVQAQEPAKPAPALSFTVKDIDGKSVDLAKTYQGKVLLVVNVASKCGLTPQYEELEEVYEKFKGKGFEVLGFPANEFGKQEPGSDSEIKAFCTSKYSVTFPMYSKVVVKGAGIDPFFNYLTSPKTNPKFAGPIAWNFNKFLINRKGEVIARFEPKVKPDSPEVLKAIEAALADSK